MLAPICALAKEMPALLVTPCAAVPWDRVLESVGMNTFLHAQVQCLEWVSVQVHPAASRRAGAGRAVTQGINVWDMKGLTLSAFTARVRRCTSTRCNPVLKAPGTRL
jgi:hypothetical protein